jgi:hypothetical protein
MIYDVQHICSAGVKNIVADSFSRLVESTKVPIGDILAINESKRNRLYAISVIVNQL